jgi:hypothetical protein
MFSVGAFKYGSFLLTTTCMRWNRRVLFNNRAVQKPVAPGTFESREESRSEIERYKRSVEESRFYLSQDMCESLHGR